MTSQQYAHEIAPHYDTTTPLTPHDRARYHLARAIGFFKAMQSVGVDESLSDAVSRYLPEAHLAFLHYALTTESSDPGLFAQQFMHEESGEWIYEFAVAVGLDPDAIRPYVIDKAA